MHLVLAMQHTDKRLVTSVALGTYQPTLLSQPMTYDALVSKHWLIRCNQTWHEIPCAQVADMLRATVTKHVYSSCKSTTHTYPSRRTPCSYCHGSESWRMKCPLRTTPKTLDQTLRLSTE